MVSEVASVTFAAPDYLEGDTQGIVGVGEW